MSAGPDLQAPDLATPDLATPSDLTVPPDFYGYTLCANTMAASTCVQTFFQQVASCFPVPMSNPCTLDTDNATYSNLCYGPTQKVLSTISGDTGQIHSTWYTNGMDCLDADITPIKGAGSQDVFTVGNQILMLDEQTGAVTCPDGSSISIGANLGGCADLQQLVHGPKGCAAGVCQ